LSRTTRAFSHSLKAYVIDYAFWATVSNGAHHCARMERFGKRLGRDGGCGSSCVFPLWDAPDFIDRWREDEVEGPNLKRSAKRARGKMRRRHNKTIVARAILDLEDAR
jgi:hypothetical protein